MLELRPGCENCDDDLPADDSDPDRRRAYICSFECTWCQRCAEAFSFTCPNCSGILVERPARPAGLLATFPASEDRLHSPVADQD